MGVNVISLFSGAGGLDYGFKKAGSKIVWANDINEVFCKTYKKNIKEKIVCANIKDISPSEIPEGDIIVGGFPCLGFTIARGSRRDINDEKNYLYKDFIKILEDKKPKLFLVENVLGMNQGEKFSKLFKELIQDFSDVGYKVKHNILNAADYGVPQFRKRIIILGSRRDLDIKISYPEKTHSVKSLRTLKGKITYPLLTIKDAIEDLPEPGMTNIENHICTKHKVKINNYIGNRRLFWNRPSPTITGRGSLSGGPVIHPHPNLKRRLTIRECARIQSFPDDFEFIGSMTSCYAQVGNAVPPLLALRIAQSIMESIGETPKHFNREDWILPWVDKIPEI